MASETQFNFRKHKSDLRKLSLVIFISIDLLYAGVLAASLGKVCDTPLKTWLVGAILLVSYFQYINNSFMAISPTLPPS